MGKDERHYNINKLNVVFAVVSVVLLLTLMSVFMNDYDRDWKDYQRQFRTIEIEKARVKLDKENIELSQQAEYEELEGKIAAAKQAYKDKCLAQTELQEQIEEANAKLTLVEQDYKFRKAEFDAAKYRFEHGEAYHEHDVDQYREAFQSLDQQVTKLALDVEEAKTALKSKQRMMDNCGAQLAQLERDERQMTARQSILVRQLDSIDPNAMNLTNQVANMVRDLPILELANPRNKVEQIVLKDVTEDVNFMNVPRVDRCTTCHLGITNPDYVNEAQPFTTHPNLELYVGKNSPHPLEEFGCTVCHAGRPRGTSFNGAVHVPSSPQQKKEWEEKYGYHQMELWEEPMLPLPYTEAGCYKCHSGEFPVKGAEKLSTGLAMIETAGCYACHEIERYKDWPKPGPNLTKLAGKIDKEWGWRWLNDPHSFRHNTMMPSYFNQSNNSDVVSKKRSDQEIHAILHYLFENAQPYPSDRLPIKGDPARGEELVASVGCYACHQIQPEKGDEMVTVDGLRRRFGPNLIDIGTKTSARWLYNWLKDPNSYHPDTAMPNLRLTDQEAADIASFLIQDKNNAFSQHPVPAVNVNVLNDIVLGFLKRADTDQGARNTLAGMKLEQKLEFAGEKLIAQYGCFSCHNIKGFDNAKPIGVALSEESSKSLHKFDFGFLHIEHSKHAWYAQKLKDPRSFDKGKIKAPDEKLRMPNFNLKNDEIEAIVTALLGFVDESQVQAKIKPRTPENLAKEQGEELVAQFNCRGCHMVEGQGGSIHDSVEKWLVDFEEKTDNEAAKVRDSFSPPNLHGVGRKLNPEWLFNFLHEPKQKVRPWLRVRMPTFNFNVVHLNTLVKYFQAVDGDNFPLKINVETGLTDKEYEAAAKLFSEDYFGCTQCHVVGSKLPTGSQDSWAPNLALAKTRLQPEWLIEWIKNPSKLMPGTKMPTFFDPENYDTSGPDDLLDGNENEQIRVLRNFLLTLSEEQQRDVAAPVPETP
ncbi:MAG: c-type cytochrome [Candidatus Omnitrophica bacterium]|nr:c-type cytochrome [Candidatus Omnitrophota bacterium]